MTLVHQPDDRVADWLAPRLGPFGAWVGSLVPRGFEAYARVLHPCTDAAGEAARWADVAAACGTVLHPTAQWWRLARASDWAGDTGEWPGGVPGMGSLDPTTLAAVADVLAAHGDDGPGADVVAAMWEGFGWVQGGGGVVFGWGWEGDDPPTPDQRAAMAAETAERNALLRAGAFAPAVMAAPRLELENRGYLLFRGTLGDLPDVMDDDGPWSTPGIGSWHQSPNLLWPTDRSWCLATEIDLDSTVVGGSAALVAALLAHPDLEVLPVREGDSLMADGDAVNAPVTD